jgi:hypothetical protein
LDSDGSALKNSSLISLISRVGANREQISNYNVVL